MGSKKVIVVSVAAGLCAVFPHPDVVMAATAVCAAYLGSFGIADACKVSGLPDTPDPEVSGRPENPQARSVRCRYCSGPMAFNRCDACGAPA